MSSSCWREGGSSEGSEGGLRQLVRGGSSSRVLLRAAHFWQGLLDFWTGGSDVS